MFPVPPAMDESEVGIIGMIGYTGRPPGPVQQCPQLIFTESCEQMWDYMSDYDDYDRLHLDFIALLLYLLY